MSLDCAAELFSSKYTYHGAICIVSKEDMGAYMPLTFMQVKESGAFYKVYIMPGALLKTSVSTKSKDTKSRKN